ncbi:MAG TPA: hypothetical protein VKR60_12045 [Candidatus Sulfotelmatobacter sp.]|nr:hypothetical protein [Candidatus Sulfotelmatobacter sp.]
MSVALRYQPKRLCFRLPLAALALFLCSAPGHAADPATVTFTLDFPGSDPERYSISVSADGHSKYVCSAKISEESDERETYQSEFELSPAGRQRIFDLAAQAHFFAGKVDSGNKKLAFTGSKTLAYSDGQRNSSAKYNYSAIPPVQQLTAYFQNLSATLEYGRHLTYFHRYQKLALDEELKHMEEQARDNSLGELQAVQPVLQQILDDTTVINIVRARAERLLEMGKAAASH